MFGTPEEIQAELQRLADQFEELLAELRRAKATQQDTTGHENPRIAAVIALGAVLDFLTWMPEVQRERLHEPLANLRQALLDSQRRLEPSLCERPASANRRKRDATERQVRWATAACAMNLLMKAGVSRRDAASEVAGLFNRAGWSLQTRDSLMRMKTLEYWRDEARKERENFLPVKTKKHDSDLDEMHVPKFLIEKMSKFPISDASEAKKSAEMLIDWVANRYPASGRGSG